MPTKIHNVVDVCAVLYLAFQNKFGKNNPYFNYMPKESIWYILRSIKWAPGISRNLVVRSKLPLGSGSVSLRQLNLIHRKGPWSFLLIVFSSVLWNVWFLVIWSKIEGYILQLKKKHFLKRSHHIIWWKV